MMLALSFEEHIGHRSVEGMRRAFQKREIGKEAAEG